MSKERDSLLIDLSKNMEPSWSEVSETASKHWTKWDRTVTIAIQVWHLNLCHCKWERENTSSQRNSSFLFCPLWEQASWKQHGRAWQLCKFLCSQERKLFYDKSTPEASHTVVFFFCFFKWIGDCDGKYLTIIYTVYHDTSCASPSHKSMPYPNNIIKSTHHTEWCTSKFLENISKPPELSGLGSEQKFKAPLGRLLKMKG